MFRKVQISSHFSDDHRVASHKGLLANFMGYRLGLMQLGLRLHFVGAD